MAKAQSQLQISLAQDASTLSCLLGELCSVPNGDLHSLPGFRGCATKGFPHDSKGYVNQDKFALFLKALARGDLTLLSRLRPNGPMALLSPSAIFSCELSARHSSCYPLAHAFPILGEAYSCQLNELFAMARLRDVPFLEWPNHKTVSEVAKELSSWPLIMDSVSANMPRLNTNHIIDSSCLFRGTTAGDLEGPYVSQFLLLPYTEGMTQFNQQYTTLPAKKDYLVTKKEFLHVLSGNAPLYQDKDLLVKEKRKYIATLRDGASIVRCDEIPTRFAEIAALIIAKLQVPIQSLERTLPLETGFVSFGFPDLKELLNRASKLALNAAWYAKYVHVQARPEQAAFVKDSISDSISNSGRNSGSNSGRNSSSNSSSNTKKCKQIQWALATYGTGLLPQAYPEGAPLSPSSPSAHGAVIGACVTVLKAWYECKTRLPRVWEATADGTQLQQSREWKAGSLSVEGELDKLASNIALFRAAAGVNTRADAERGIRLGERVALALLQDAIKRYEYEMEWEIRRRDGTRVTISNILSPPSVPSHPSHPSVPSSSSYS